MCRLSILRIAALALALLAGGAAAQAQGPPPKGPERALLRLMGKGSRATYDGRQAIEMHVRGRQARGSAHVGHLNQTTRTEILSPPRLAGMLILEHGGRRLTRRPGSDRWQAGMGGGQPQPRRMLVNYTVVNQGPATIAGRMTSILEVRARAGGRLARKIWVDQETGVVLRAEMYNWSGQLVYATEFQQIDYTPQLDPRDFNMAGLVPPAPPQPDRVPLDPSAIPRPTYIPAGFQAVGHPNGIRTRRGDAAHLRYSDGLSTISVFIRKLTAGENPKSPGILPPMDQPFSAVVHHVNGNYRVTVIGDIDPNELHRMADSIQ